MTKLTKTNENGINYIKSENLLQDAKIIIDTARDYAYKAVNFALVKRNWLLGKRIAEEELRNENRAEYGAKVIFSLAEELTNLYGKGFDYSTLYKFVRFYKCFPEILDSASPKLERLSWTHFRVLLQVNDEAARQWYAAEAATEAWSVKTLQRNISSQYYYRLLQTKTPDAVNPIGGNGQIIRQLDGGDTVIQCEIQIITKDHRLKHRGGIRPELTQRCGTTLICHLGNGTIPIQ